ncbi:tRNA (guanosine(46)-N7)-methyltransferase TrmB [Aminipila luticellarii]|uniref:tRNA (guanine-N(7)-)-methyltransferase n=1 Tax=Aminipila luticellarii TaxID=2507160 RepID=A0A410PT68_9FIRM|nr:tRNA (guanosine(46)-N7)-methyltransferase TrmB [Aminipila luticellarii]QAT42086.1 tRNA (guanosine(46)-N7)-methyltransferase TrmB [Aminipila luticellarii]
MRQRKAKNMEERLAACSAYSIADGQKMKGSWKSVFQNENDIYMELGCGKGQFVLKQAELHPDRNYIAVEGQESVVLQALEKAAAANIPNIRFLSAFMRDVTEYFEEGELSGIYLNFSDPWPKERHAKRRLTHSNFLKGYARVVKDGGILEFKTDNDSLFEFTIQEIKANDYEIIEYSRDLHNSEFLSRHVTTEYEDKFNALDKNINFVKVIL